MSGARPDTWMPLYWGDYLKDTGRLTTEGHGAYLLLIADYWTSGAPLPDDDLQLAAIVRLPLSKWRALRKTLVHFFEISDGFWRHSRIEHELELARELTARRSEAGKEGAKATWSHKQTHGRAIGNRISKRMAEPLSNVKQTHAPSPSQSPKKETPDAIASVPLSPEAPDERPTRKPKSRTRISADWQPDEQDLAFACEHGWGLDRAVAEGDHCRDYHLAKGTLTADIHATWRTWVQNGVKFDTEKPRGHSNGRLSPADALALGTAQALAERERARDSGSSDDLAEPLLDGGRLARIS